MKTGGNSRRAALANRLSVRRQSGAALQQTAHSIDLLGEVNPRKAIGQTPVSAARNKPLIRRHRHQPPGAARSSVISKDHGWTRLRINSSGFSVISLPSR